MDVGRNLVMMRRFLATLSVVAVAFAIGARAAEPINPIPFKKPVDTSKSKPDIELTPEQIALQQAESAIKQDYLKRQFDEFKQSLLRLAHRLESSTKREDKDKAAILKDAIKQASEQGIDNKFNTLMVALKNAETFKDVAKLEAILDKNKDLQNDLRALIELLLKDDRDKQLREERMSTERLLERLKEIISKQERVRAQTEQGRKEAADLKREQEKVTKETGNLIGKKDEKADTKKGD